METRLRELMKSFPVTAQVVAPVPWFPVSHDSFGPYGAYAQVPARETRDELEVFHPRYPVIPRLSWRFSPPLLAMATYRCLKQVIRSGYDFDLIDAHFVYPDGVAAVILGQMLKKPVVLTARGNDISLMPRYKLPRTMIVWAAQRAAAIITVCQALKDAVVGLNIPDEKVYVLRNGVDLKRFKPVDRQTARKQLQLSGRVLLSVGHLIERKGNHVTIEALRKIPGATLLLVGDGEEENHLREQARVLGIESRVRFEGAVPQTDLPRYYAAADALVLASSREGWANVLLESMACGTPVIASAIWGTPEIVTAPEAGVLMASRDAASLVEAYERLFQSPPDRGDTRRFAEQFSWDATSRGQFDLFSEILGRDRSAATG